MTRWFLRQRNVIKKEMYRFQILDGSVPRIAQINMKKSMISDLHVPKKERLIITLTVFNLDIPKYLFAFQTSLLPCKVQ